jgi:hypothetical protein
VDSPIRTDLNELAARGIFVGTSSWKYPGWRDFVYVEQRYLTRGKFSEAKFNRECLAEYAETFHTVCHPAQCALAPPSWVFEQTPSYRGICLPRTQPERCYREQASGSV